MLLINYLPSEVSHCSLLFTSFRDLIAQKVLNSFTEMLSDTQWLNALIISLLVEKPMTAITTSKDKDFNTENLSNEKNGSTMQKSAEGQERTLCYIHSLSAIREETSFDLSDIENDLKSGAKISPQLLRRLSSLGGNAKSFSKEILDEIPEDEVKKPTFENASDLVNYIKVDQQREDSSVKSALGDMISTTAIPLLPDSCSSSNQLQPLPSKMWISPVDEKDILAEVAPLRKRNLFKKGIIEGIKEEDYKILLTKRTENTKRDLLNVSAAEDVLGGGELLRSKSWNDLSQDPKIDLDIENKPKLSLSSENLFSPSEAKHKKQLKKRDKKLTKMDSFDKNDGAEDITEEDGKEKKQDGSTDNESTEMSPVYEESESLASTIEKLR